MEYTANQIRLRGSIAELPRFSHENHDKRFYSFSLEVLRLSGNLDVLPIIVPEQVLQSMELTDGSMLEVTGQIRTFNNKAPTGRRLVISVYAESMQVCEGEDLNQVYLSGRICKPPVYRQTPLGREICDVMLAVNRPYHRADYIPCIFWGKTAGEVGGCEVGDQLQLTGRLQSREYVKLLGDTSEQRTAYEVSAMTAEKI